MMSTLPFFPEPSWSMSLDLEGRSFGFQFDWRPERARWHMRLCDAAGVEICSGVELVVRGALLKGCVDPRRPAGDFGVVSTMLDTAPPGRFDFVEPCKHKLVYIPSDWMTRAGDVDSAKVLSHYAWRRPPGQARTVH